MRLVSISRSASSLRSARWGLLLCVAPVLAPPGGSAQEALEAPDDWAQGVEYRIEASLDESTDVLDGRARVRYRNDSPYTLDTFYFHLYLNAFRPNSAWARRDLEFGRTTFQELGPEEHAFERIHAMTVDGQVVDLRYPFAPDSTIVGFDLPEALPPGGTLTIDYDWRARLSTVPRRQGRRGRSFDFAQWYPRVVVYDDEGWRIHPLYRAGEFYGEFATYDVTLEVRDDQVMGSTGVPVDGDPGWEGASALGTGPVDYQREWYGSLEGPPCIERAGERVCGVFPARRLPPEESLDHLADEPIPGRKQVRWRAEDVHHFAWSTSPDYIYEQGRWDDVTIRVLYRPGDEESWGGGVAVRRTAVALQWLDRLFGDYAYPQVTNLHRIEGGGTEFPMVVMDGSPSQGLINHEVGHIYAHGMLANNEWYEGWLDEGMSTFQSAWFVEEASGAGAAVWQGRQMRTLMLDLQGISEPVVLPAEDYAEYAVYSSMIYSKGAVILYMLREMAGEADFRRILRTYFDRHKLSHVDSDDFKKVAEEVMRADLDWFFGQWLHQTGVVDYALDDVEVRQAAGSWITTLEIERKGDFVMPVPVRLSGPGGISEVVLEGTDLEQRSALRTTFEPTRVEIDPDGTIMDWNVGNNAWSASVWSDPALDVALDNPLRPVPTRWRTVPVGLFPLGWYNDAGGWVGGLQLRSAKLGLADRWLVRVGLPGIEGGDKGGLSDDTDFGSLYARVENPVLGGGRPSFGTTLEGFVGEGRGFSRVVFSRTEQTPPFSGRPSSVRVFGSTSWIYDESYLVPGRWTPGSRLGLEVGIGASAVVGPDDLPLQVDVDGATGFDTQDSRYLRMALEVEGTRPFDGDWLARGRAFVGLAIGRDPADGSWGNTMPRERMFFLAGGDPYRAVSNPWARSAGGVLDEEGFVPGGGELRGFHPGVAAAQLLAGNLEVVAPPVAGEVRGTGVSLRAVGFGGLATTGDLPLRDGPTFDDPRAIRDIAEAGHLFYTAGVGLELGVDRSPVRVRLDLPLVLSDPAVATRGHENTVDFRWTLAIVGG